MKLQAFSVYDSMVEAFMPPFFVRARGEAMRLFMDLANDASTNVGKHPMDFMLMWIGEFDDKSGSVVALDNPSRVISGIECVNNALAAEAEQSEQGRAVPPYLASGGKKVG